MKTLIVATGLLLASQTAIAASFEEVWQNPDLGTGVYDKPVTLIEPIRSGERVSVSLDQFNEGNPEHAPHAQPSGILSSDSKGDFASSLDEFNRGNPDHV